MITLFTIPKSFRGHIATIQRNAIQSWLQLRPACEIILFGDDEGAADTAREFGLRHIPDVARNEYGTPLLNSLFELAQAVANHRLLAYVNADIILLSDFMAAVRRIPFRRFVMVSQRRDLDLNQPWDFSHPDWEAHLRAYLSEYGVLHEPAAIDWFVFSPGVWDPILPFAIGRTAWDIWLMYQACARGVAVVNATRAVTAIHQNHGYTHVPGGFEEVWKGPEAQRNLALAGDAVYNRLPFNLHDATWLLSQHWLLPSPLALTRRLSRKKRRLQRHIAIQHPHLYKVLRVFARPHRLLSFIARYMWYHLLKRESVSN
jgi:hypothetical protein